MNIENLKEKIEQFYEDHPIWFWLLVRLAVCTAIMLIAIFCLSVVACIVFAIAALIGGYCGFLAIFLIIIPVLCVCVWAAFSAFKFIYENLIEE